ncbi:type VI secretion system protein ImpH [Variovorax boronicumulans]|uniref:type VI secretion system baseplate subunit TssG n=1 Tax=Variovorax boronicumulans TaxID=436515 RepID=UPI002783211F|nr:type VI secretion system baseplate subunit TssG [Variovorax boronicumulans]MDP9913369.1 type VI secretion system protein ImpH [Variovorax boronicumulans]
MSTTGLTDDAMLQMLPAEAEAREEAAVDARSPTHTKAKSAPRRGVPEADPALWARLVEQPFEHDLFMLLRRLDAQGGHPLLGRAPRPRDEPLRLGQEPSMAFAPSNVSGVEVDEDGAPRISIYGFGLFGPNGPLPLHLTEYARERKRHHADNTLSAFADLFHHRLILLFYRAWADAQSVNSLDRTDGHRFVDYVASLMNMGQPGLKARDRIADHARTHMAGHLVRQTRNPEGLIQILRLYFDVPVRVVEFVSDWVHIDERQVSRIGLLGRNQRLGSGATIGLAVRDAQGKFRLELGPLSQQQFREFLPGSPRLQQVVDWVRQYVGIEFAWELRLVLSKPEARGMRLSSDQRLGWGSWLGTRLSDTDAGDMVFQPEALFSRNAPASS